MSDTWRFPPPLLLLLLLGALCGADTRCAPTSFYRNCWIRRFPGIFIDVDESARRGAQLLRGYEENSALQCSRSCCLSRNFSCNLAVFHYDTVQETVNCFHLHCPTMESCILKHRGNVILYNITAGADPDLLVFGKYFSNTRAWPQLSSRLNSSDGHVSDKRHFNRLPVAPVLPRTPSSSPRPGNKFTVSSTSVTHAPPPVSAVGSAGTSPTPRSVPVIPRNTKPPPPSQSTSTHIPHTVFSLSITVRTTKTSPTDGTSTFTTPTTSPTDGTSTFTTPTTSPTDGTSTFTTPTTSPTDGTSTFTTPTTSPTDGTSTFTTPTFTTPTTSPTDSTSTFTTPTTSPTDGTSTFTTSAASPKAASSTLTTAKTSSHEGSPSYTIPSTSSTARSSTKSVASRPIIARSVSQVGTQISVADISLPIKDKFASPTIPDLHISSSSTSSTQTTGDTSIATPRTTTSAPSSPKPSFQLSTGVPLDPHSHSLPMGPANIDSGKQHPNDTKGYANRNHSAAEAEGGVAKPDPEAAAWFVAARALLVPVVVGSAVLLSCCCGVLLAVSWRDKRKRRYGASWGKEKGSTRLVKYVIVRESR
ncbi:MANSC domain-containing protein 4-like [Arapaima gigas]